MAEITAFRNNALPYPIYGAPWTLAYPLLDADGDPVTGLTPDPEVSKNGDTGVNCATAGAEIPFTTATNKGMYYTPLSAAEMTADIVAVTVYAATAKATALVLYPRKLVTLRSGTSQGGAAGYITLDASAGAVDDTWNGCLCVATIDGNVEARIISDYTGSNKQAAVVPDWNVAPDSDDTFIIYLPEGREMPVALASVGTGAGQLNASGGKVPATIAAGDAVGLPAVAAGAKGGLPILDASTGTILTGFGGATIQNDLVNAPNATALTAARTEMEKSGSILYALNAIFTGITSLPAWLRGLFRKDAMNATAKTEVNSGGGTFNEATDSNEALRDTAPMGSAMNTLAATDIVTGGAITTSGGKVSGVILADTVTTYTGNTLQTGNVATLITTVGAAGAGLTALPAVTLANSAHGGNAATITLMTPIVANVTQIKTVDADTAISARVDASALGVRILGMLVVDGLVYQFTANALELGPSGSALTAQQTRDAMALALTGGTPTPATGIDGKLAVLVPAAAVNVNIEEESVVIE